MSMPAQLRAVPPLPEFVTIREAALIAGKSTTWIRNLVATGLLEAQRAPNGHMQVAALSIASLIRATADRTGGYGREEQGATLRLVIDNT